MDDLISRKAALDAVKNCECWVDSGYRTVLEYDTAYDAIRDVPTADKNGKWEEYCGDLLCDQCGNVVEIYGNKGKWNYCPNCGARMGES